MHINQNGEILSIMEKQLLSNSEINEAVARKLGWIKINLKAPSKPAWKDPSGKIRGWDAISNYCTDIKAASEIPAKFPSIDGYCFYIEWLPAEGVWCAGWRQYQQFEGWVGLANDHHADAPMAICLAFLKLP